MVLGKEAVLEPCQKTPYYFLKPRPWNDPPTKKSAEMKFTQASEGNLASFHNYESLKVKIEGN